MHACDPTSHTPLLLLEGVACNAMASSTPGQSSLELLDQLDEQLKRCTPLEECPGEQGYGLDYAVRLEAIWKVSSSGYQPFDRC